MEKLLVALLVFLTAAAVQPILGEETTESHAYCFTVHSTIKPSCPESESKLHTKLVTTYQNQVLKKACKAKKGCELVSLEGSCDETSSNSHFFTVGITLTCKTVSACEKNFQKVEKSIKKRNIKLTSGETVMRLKVSQITTESCPTTLPPTTTETPTTMESTTLPPTTETPTTMKSTTTAPTTVLPTTLAPPCYNTLTKTSGAIINPTCCTTVCGECKHSNDLGVLLSLQSLAVKTDPGSCSGIQISDGECSKASHYSKKYETPYVHISKSKCACVCFRTACKPPSFKIFYGTYQKELSGLVNFVLGLPEAQSLLTNSELLPKLFEALCDKSKAFGLVAEPQLGPIIAKVPFHLAASFLGKKK